MKAEGEKGILQQEIYPVTEGINSDYTKKVYKDSFNRFLRYVKVHDLRVLIDFGSKVLEQIIIKYVIYVYKIIKYVIFYEMVL